MLAFETKETGFQACFFFLFKNNKDDRISKEIKKVR